MCLRLTSKRTPLRLSKLTFNKIIDKEQFLANTKKLEEHNKLHNFQVRATNS